MVSEGFTNCGSLLTMASQVHNQQKVLAIPFQEPFQEVFFKTYSILSRSFSRHTRFFKRFLNWVYRVSPSGVIFSKSSITIKGVFFLFRITNTSQLTIMHHSTNILQSYIMHMHTSLSFILRGSLHRTLHAS